MCCALQVGSAQEVIPLGYGHSLIQKPLLPVVRVVVHVRPTGPREHLYIVADEEASQEGIGLRLVRRDHPPDRQQDGAPPPGHALRVAGLLLYTPMPFGPNGTVSRS